MRARSLAHTPLRAARVADDRGMAMPLALLTLLVLAALVSALLGLGIAEPQIAANLVHGAQALNLSEAGAERSVNFFRLNEGIVQAATCSPCPGATTAQWSNVALANLGTYTVTYQPIGDMTVALVSTGQTPAGTASRTTRAVLTMQYDPGPYAILADDTRLTGNATVSGTMGSVQGNSALSLTGSSFVSTGATTGATSCSGCTDPDHVGNVGLSGTSKPTQTIKTLEPQSLRPYADYIMGKEIGGIMLPLITIVATGETVVAGTGSMAAWSAEPKIVSGTLQWAFKCCSGGRTPANGAYYTGYKIEITSNPGPWQATLIAGTTAGTGTIDFSGGPTMTPDGDPHLLDLVVVAGTVDITGNPELTGAVVARNVDIKGNLELRGNIIATGSVSVTGSAEIIYDRRTRTPIIGPLRVVNWSNS